jgi:thioredoxin reductase
MRLPEHIDLLVVGAGPTGLAALVEAKKTGQEAIAVDKGAGPLASLAGYMNGLVLVSDATQFEVGRLPLDCAAASSPTREEAISYFSRVVSHHDLAIAPRHRAIRLEPRRSVGESVLVELEAEGRTTQIRARDVLVTAWYEPRPPPPELVDPTGRVHTFTRVADLAALPGTELVVVGGGLSALEHAIAGMLAGKTVTVVARGPVARSFRRAPILALVEATGSRIVPHAGNIRVDADGVRFGTELVRCRSVIACIGFRVIEPIAAMLVDAGVLTADTLAALHAARGPDHWRRQRPTMLPEQLVELVVGERPDLHQLLHEGVGGVRLAGGALHIGGPDAGVATSIFTAEIAVRRVAGLDTPSLAPPLPRSLADWVRRSDPPELRYGDIAEIRPLRLRTASRIGFGHERESRVGLPTSVTDGDGRAPEALADPEDARICQHATGALSAAALADAVGCAGPAAREAFAARLVRLLRSGPLTWLPRPSTLHARA